MVGFVRRTQHGLCVDDGDEQSRGERIDEECDLRPEGSNAYRSILCRLTPVHPEARPKWTNGVIRRAPRRIFLQMSVEQAMPGRLVRWLSAAEPDWDAVYADQLPRVYNFFRYRFGVDS